MRLESALLAGREGIVAHGQAISVVGDNLANSNTDGYKYSRVEFSDLLADSQASGAGNAGSTGAGVAVSKIRPMLEEGGTIEPTGRELDAAIDGQGFFMVGSAANPSYTRAGSFSIDTNGNLVNLEGQPVLGLAPGATALSAINLANIKLTGSVTTSASVTGNLDARLGAVTVPATVASWQELGKSQSAGITVDVYDSLGQKHGAWVSMFKTGPNTWTAQAYLDGAEVGGTAGVPVSIGSAATLAFNNTGAIDDANKASAVITATPAYSNGSAPGNFKIDLSGFTQFASPSATGSIAQDGQAAGSIKGFSIEKDGKIYAVLDSGASQLAGTIQLADFTNRGGLSRSGNTLYVATENIGKRTTGTPNSGTLGGIQGGSVERSTVDTSSQFIDLVLYQRGYQASSQIINAASQLIRDTLGLIR